MKTQHLIIGLSLLLMKAACASGDVAISDWKKFFNDEHVEGTILVVDERKGKKETLVYNPKRSKKRFSPASTFKLPHALFVLDAQIVRDEFEVIPWDGVERTHAVWNKSQTLRSSIQHSVVWVYEGFAKSLGAKREKEYMSKISYGNCSVSGKAPFWINGSLSISAQEQMKFLKNLYSNALPFDRADQLLVKDCMIVEAERDWRLRAKTGWTGKLAWWVGWVEHTDGVVFFVMNIDTPQGYKNLKSCEKITRKILSSIKALPSK